MTGLMGAARSLRSGHPQTRTNHPVLRRYGVVPTICLCSQIVATPRRFWFEQPGRDAQPYERLRNDEQSAALARDCDFEPERVYPLAECQALSAEETAEMAPWVDFQPHTRSRPVWTQFSDEKALCDISDSKCAFEERLDRPCRQFSYPNGDYLECKVELARRAGYASARTVDLGRTRVNTDPFRLPCYGIADDASIDMLVAQPSGISGYVRRRLQKRRGGRWPVRQPDA